MKSKYLIIGAGFTGATIAREIAEKCNKSVLIIDKREHLAGNAFDKKDENGFLVHQYGPHIFHTNSTKVWKFLSRFTRWNYYEHRVLAYIENKYVPVPFNFTSIETLISSNKAQKIKKYFLENYGNKNKVSILILMQSNNHMVKEFASYVYNELFLPYTKKMWGVEPEELDPLVLSRVPIKIGYEDRYFDDKYQGIPKEGYDKLFLNILDHPNIQVNLKTNFKELTNLNQFERIIYTGPIDEYFDYRYGELPYRSIRFKFLGKNTNLHQKVAVINYPSYDFKFTRSTEFKHMTHQKIKNTILCQEYPEAYKPNFNLPYYPILTKESESLFRKYKTESEKLKNRIIFLGRLGEFKYVNMDQAVARSLQVFNEIYIK
jgi:UDP-galactopyranose mutase